MFIFTLLLIITPALCATFPTVTVNDGKIQGYILNTINGREIAAFEGIPYAEPPIGDLRFEVPQAKKPWVDTWKANTLYTCLQYAHEQAGIANVKGNEDCLYLNVYKPNEQLLNDLNVIVYIHGGAFMFNSGGRARPFYIMDKNIVFVTINYRLGPLGFLSLEDEILPGNNGLKDQNLALKWVKSNIHHFGGNPNSITIVGMSAGGASVHLHTLSSLSKGLFHNVIAQSGVALNAWVLVENAREKAHKLSDLLGCSYSTSMDLLNCLKTRPARQIVEAVKYFQVFLYNPFTPFGPVVDKKSINPFLPEHPLSLIKKKQIEDVPILFSYVSCEGLYPAADFATDSKHLKTIDKKWNEIIPYVLDYYNTVSKKDIKEVSQKIREAYLKDEHVTMKMYDNLVQMISDRMFLKDINDATLIQSEAIRSSVYSYKFSHIGQNGMTAVRAPNVKFNCTSHADDTFYVTPPKDFMRTTESDAKISDIFIDIWTSFARNGYPVVDNVEWLPVAKDKGIVDYLHIASPDDIKMESEENVGNSIFWNTLPIRENEKLFQQKNEL